MSHSFLNMYDYSLCFVVIFGTLICYLHLMVRDEIFHFTLQKILDVSRTLFLSLCS